MRAATASGSAPGRSATSTEWNLNARAGDGKPLALTAGEHRRNLFGAIAEPQQVQKVTSPRFRRLTANSTEDRGQRDVVQRGDAFEQVEELEDDADVVATELRQPVLVLAADDQVVDYDFALICLFETGEDVEQCGLATAGRAHEADELALRHIQVDAAQRPHRRQLRFERAAHTACLQSGHRTPPRVSMSWVPGARTRQAVTAASRPLTLVGASCSNVHVGASAAVASLTTVVPAGRARS